MATMSSGLVTGGSVWLRLSPPTHGATACRIAAKFVEAAAVVEVVGETVVEVVFTDFTDFEVAFAFGDNDGLFSEEIVLLLTKM